jgi:hypothetical protein
MRCECCPPFPFTNHNWIYYAMAVMALDGSDGGGPTGDLFKSAYLSELSHLGHEIPDEV